MPDKESIAPESSAVRVALWRTLHLEADPTPHVFEDRHGLAVAAPEGNWRARPDMDPDVTARVRASIVARARFIEDLVTERMQQGVGQYVVLGAGLDTFVQRRPEIASRMRVYEVDQPGPQAWKRRRLIDLGFGVPNNLRLVPVDFEAGADWWRELGNAGFDADRPAIVVSTGVSMYLSREAIIATLRQVAALAAGSTFAMTFMQPLELVEPEERALREATEAFARAAGTPFISFLSPAETLALARHAGFKTVEHVSAYALAVRYFSGRRDALRPSSSEELIIAAR